MENLGYDLSINKRIRDNEIYTTDWSLNPVSNELYWFVDFFNMAFFKDQPVPTPVLTFESTNVKNLGYYRIGYNDWAIKDQINLNKLYLNRPLQEVLQTLVHEMVHSWEHLYLDEKARTVNWYHKKGFKTKMNEIGIITDDRGTHHGVQDPFVFLLKKHGVQFPKMERGTKGGYLIIPTKTKPKGKSKLAKWSCGCTNLRVGIKDLEALCLKCGNVFEQ